MILHSRDLDTNAKTLIAIAQASHMSFERRYQTACDMGEIIDDHSDEWTTLVFPDGSALSFSHERAEYNKGRLIEVKQAIKIWDRGEPITFEREVKE
jgi:hypothetical protein